MTLKAVLKLTAFYQLFNFLSTLPRGSAVVVQLLVPATKIHRGLPPPSIFPATPAKRTTPIRLYTPCLAHIIKALS